ncbi:MAG: glycosyltransferase [Labilithrix sp.]|nr:glycosyltransferase [Labilithrix sp.]MCW5811175.1 glycosyltransferase [Labilithrix sp.]
MIDAIVFDAAAEPWLAARTVRALARQGIDATVANGDLAARVASASRPVWLVRAGAWPFSPPAPVLAHATGPTVAVGATADCTRWRSVLARTGGDLARGVGDEAPRVDSAVAFDPRSFAELVAASGTVDKAALAAARVVRAPSLDVGYHRALRVVLAVTTLHRGGAERVVLDLARELRALGHDVQLAVLDRPARATFDAPPGTIHLRDHACGRVERLDLLARIATERGADAVHVHLFDGDDVVRLCAGDVPVVVTVHNSEPGWPARLRHVATAARPPLLFACSRDVAAGLHAAGLGARTRTIWNGVVPSPPAIDRATARRALGVDDDAPVLVAIANHRPQKRLERLPAVLAALPRGDARLVLVGEPVSADPEALAIEAHVRAEAAKHGVTERVVFAGSQGDVGAAYAAADAIVSASAFEGLSLVHLEALAAGVPLVTTDVAGTAELAAKHSDVHRVSPNADAPTFAAAVAEALAERAGSVGAGGGGERALSGGARSGAERAGSGGAALASEVAGVGGLAADFTAWVMAERHVELYARVGASAQRGSAAARLRGGVVLVTNNFSTGGAQSSARRLLVQLRAEGVRVRAIVIEEQEAYPTPGRSALAAAGVPVAVAPRAGAASPIVTARAVATMVDAAEPDAVLFWNVIPEHKVLIADLLVGVPVWDVSPGEMYFASFARYLQRPRVGSPYLNLRDYGRLLRGAIVKYEGERERAAAALGVDVAVVPNGVEVPPIPLRRRAGARVVAGTLARIAPDKKLEELIAAVRRRPFDLVIAGAAEHGSEAYAEELRASTAGLPITWLGERDARSLLAEIDAFAMIAEPAGCPNASLEAMAAGLPIVATDHGGAREQLGGAGIIVPRADPAALADAMHTLLADAAERTRLGDAAHARAAAQLDVRQMAASYTRICGLAA